MNNQRVALPKKNSKPEEQLQELLTCQICYTLAKNIMMCPHCSKIYCQPCIKKSLFIKSQCPHCRKNIKDCHSMANCQRFVNQIKGIVEEVLREKQKDNFRCDTHDVPLNYFCLQCERSVCCECKMFGDHKDHDFVQVEKKYNQKYQKIRSMLADLKVYVREKQQMIDQFQQILTEKSNHFNEQKTNVNNLQKFGQEWYTQHRRTKKEKQKENTQSLERMVQKINEMRRSFKSEYSRLRKQGKYSFGEFQQKSILKYVSDLNSEAEQVRQNFMEVKSHLKDLVPPYTEQIFTIQNFSKIQVQAKSIIYSEPVQMLGCFWRLKIYPNGSGSVEGKYFSIYVMMVQNKAQKIRLIPKREHSHKAQPNVYEYLIQISSQASFNNEDDLRPEQSPKSQSYAVQDKKNFSSGKRFIREYSSAFEPGQSWGYIKFMELKELQAGGYIKNDRLSIKYGIRKPDYFKEYQHLASQLHSIQSEILSIEQHSASQIQQQHHLLQNLTPSHQISTNTHPHQTQTNLTN